MPLDVGRVTHLIEQMHRSEDDAGDPIDANKVLVTDGDRGFTWEDFTGGGGGGGDGEFHGVRAYHNTSQSLTNNDYTIIALNSEEYDTDDYHSTVTNNSRLTVPSGLDGQYHIFGAIAMAGNATGQRIVIVTLNETGGVDGSTEILVPVSESDPGSGGDPHLVFSTTRPLVAGDFVEMRVYQNSGGSLSVDTGSNPGDYVPSFGMFLVATSGGAGTPATTVEAETTFGITPAVGTDTEYARQDHTHGTPPDPGGGTPPPILLESGHATPFTFDEILQTSDGSDFLWASE